MKYISIAVRRVSNPDIIIHDSYQVIFGQRYLGILDLFAQCNSPSAEDIVAMWKPANKTAAEQDPNLIATVESQTWLGLAITPAAGRKREGMCTAFEHKIMT